MLSPIPALWLTQHIAKHPLSVLETNTWFYLKKKKRALKEIQEEVKERRKQRDKWKDQNEVH